MLVVSFGVEFAAQANHVAGVGSPVRARCESARSGRPPDQKDDRTSSGVAKCACEAQVTSAKLVGMHALSAPTLAVVVDVYPCPG
jgi:hypothetical protein